MLSDFDEEGLLKVIKASKLAGEITKLTWNWNISEYQKNTTHNAIGNLVKLIPYMENKIKPYESLENIVD